MFVLFSRIPCLRGFSVDSAAIVFEIPAVSRNSVMQNELDALVMKKQAVSEILRRINEIKDGFLLAVSKEGDAMVSYKGNPKVWPRSW